MDLNVRIKTISKKIGFISVRVRVRAPVLKKEFLRIEIYIIK